MGPTGAKPARKSRRRIRPTDHELLSCLAHGWTRREIAEEFDRKIGSVQMAVTRLRDRMGAKTAEHMMALYLRNPDSIVNGYWKPSAA